MSGPATIDGVDMSYEPIEAAKARDDARLVC